MNDLTAFESLLIGLVAVSFIANVILFSFVAILAARIEGDDYE